MKPEEITRLSVAQLKERLRVRGLTVMGNKPELRARLRDHMASEARGGSEKPEGLASTLKKIRESSEASETPPSKVGRPAEASETPLSKPEEDAQLKRKRIRLEIDDSPRIHLDLKDTPSVDEQLALARKALAEERDLRMAKERELAAAKDQTQQFQKEMTNCIKTWCSASCESLFQTVLSNLATATASKPPVTVKKELVIIDDDANNNGKMPTGSAIEREETLPEKKESSSEPTGLPPGWTETVSRSTGHKYYWNASLGKSQFEVPES